MSDAIGAMDLNEKVSWFNIFVAMDLTGCLLNLTFNNSLFTEYNNKQ